MHIVAQGSRTREELFDVMAGQSSILKMNRLPIGTVAFSGEAFAAACSAIGGTDPEFVADAVTTRITPGAVASVTLKMLRNGRANVSVDFEPPRLGDVTAIFDQSCVGCHNGSDARISLVADADLYLRLTTPLPSTVPTCAGDTLVVPNDPMASFLLTKIGPMPPCGNRMPLRCDQPGSTRPCLSDGDVQTITDWIASGAPPGP